jgi:hypothetical protein
MRASTPANWERRRLAGNAFKIKAAVILHSCRRDAGAPSNQQLGLFRRMYCAIRGVLKSSRVP